MSVAADTVPLFRAEWAKRFVDTCVVTRYDFTNPTFNETTDRTEYPSTQIYPPTLATGDALVDGGACLARPASASESEFGEDRRQEVDYDLYCPHNAPTFNEGDVVVVASVLDPDIPTITVLRGFQDSYLTRRHYETKAVTDA